MDPILCRYTLYTLSVMNQTFVFLALHLNMLRVIKSSFVPKIFILVNFGYMIKRRCNNLRSNSSTTTLPSPHFYQFQSQVLTAQAQTQATLSITP